MRTERKIFSESIIVTILILLVAGLSFFSGQRALVNYHLDISRHLYEAELFASGQIAYRDFTWQYPPLGLFLLGGWFKVFGAGFVQASYFFSLVSILIVGALYSLLRKVGSGIFEALAIVLFAIFFSWKSIQLEFFSLNVYTPASPVGIAFALLFLRFLWAISDVHTTHGKILCSFASTVCLAFAILSKQEVTLACLVVGCYFVCGRWLIQRVCDSARAQSGGAGFGFLTLVCGIILGVGIYLILAIFVGWENLRQGLGGYGLGGNESSRLLETLYPTFSKWCQQFKSLSDFILLTLAGIALLVTISRWNSLRSEKWVYITLSVAALVLLGFKSKYLSITYTSVWFAESIYWLLVMGLPLSTFALIAAWLWALVHRRLPQEKIADLLAASSLQLLVSFILLRHYLEGPHFFYAAPTSLASTILVAIVVARKVFWGGDVIARRISALIFLAVAMAAVVAGMYFKVAGLRSGHTALPLKTVPTSKGPITLSLRDAYHIEEMNDFVTEKMGADQTLLVLPYSAGLNFVFSRRNPLIQTQTTKMTFHGDLDKRVQEREKNHHPDFIVVLKRKHSWDWAFDLSIKDSPRLWSLLSENYKLLGVFGRGKNIELDVYGCNKAL